MVQISNFFQKDDQWCVIDVNGHEKMRPLGYWGYSINGNRITVSCQSSGEFLMYGQDITKISKSIADDDFYLSVEDFETTNKSFFVKASSSGGGNPSGVVYIEGSELVDGSIRLIADSDNAVTAQERIDGQWVESALRGNIIFAGRSSAIKTIGDILHVDAFGKHYLVVQSEYNESGSKDPRTPIVSAKSIRSISQPDETGEIVSTSISYSIIPTSDAIVDKIYYKTGSIAATEDIIWTAYPTATPDQEYVRRVIPADQWPADTEISFDFESFGLISGISFTGKLESAANFSMKSDVTDTVPWRAADAWGISYNNIANTPPWSEKTWNKDEWCIEGGLIYVANQTLAQTGSFAANAAAWDLLSDLIAKVTNWAGGITVVNFNALTSATKGDEYKLTTSGTLVGGEEAVANDTIIIKNTFTGRAITGADYDYFVSPTDIVLQTGRSGGQQVAGGTAASENLVLKSTEHATKGNIVFGTSVYDEVNNRLGIGTNNPGQTLTVKGSSYYPLEIISTNTTGVGGGGIVIHPDDFNLRSEVSVENDGDFRIWLNGDKFFIKRDTGYIGIGTSSPESLLHLYTAGTSVLTLDGNVVHNNEMGAIEFKNLYWGTANDQVRAKIASVVNSGSGYTGELAFSTSASNVAPTERVRIDRYGNVGIGTTTPTAELEVNGYTKLGSDAPAIKIKKLTSTTPAAQGSNVAIAHGLTASKIISATGVIEYSAGVYIPTLYSNVGGYVINLQWDSSNIRVETTASNSASVLSKPIKITVMYEE